MTGVVQQLATTHLLKQRVANTGTNVSTAVGLIGTLVRAASADATLANGSAQWSYHLDSDTSDLKIEVLDANGRTVDVIAPSTGDSKAGDHIFTWDGRNLLGAAQPNGAYTLRLTTKDSSGADISVGSVYVEGPVTGVEQSNGDTLITINGGKASLSQVISVTSAPASSTGASSTSSSANSSNPAGQTPAAAA
jgi:flagellar basal-body rod modification protein FlgD